MSSVNPMVDETETKPAKHNPLEQFVLLAKSAKGSACTDLIRHALETPGVYVFGELLEMPNIIEVREMRYVNELYDRHHLVDQTICTISSWRMDHIKNTSMCYDFLPMEHISSICSIRTI